MEEVTITREEYDRLVALEQKLAELEKPAPVQEPELPEAVRVQLEEAQTEIKRLKRNALTTQVELVINKAQTYRDEAGRGHSPVLLEIARNAMLGQEIGEGEGTIKLESSNPADVADYFRKVFVHLLETVPGQVQLESVVETNEEENPFSETRRFEEADYKSFWAENL